MTTNTTPAPTHRGVPLPEGRFNNATCEGPSWESLNCTETCPAHWPFTYVPTHRATR
jgi:hypothetical protein